MAAYMKTDMPHHGVQKPDREPVARDMVRRFPATSRSSLQRAVLALWRQPHREEKYLAIQYAVRHPDLIGSKSLPLYARLIREGAWWDLVDDVAIRLVGAALLDERKVVRPVLERWLAGSNPWLRRSVIISQVKHGEATDWRALFADCEASMHEREFFIAKAIGWALRAYSYTAPERVKRFLLRHRDRMRPLGFREGSKALVRQGLMAKG
jgi:3-methyladenine DNA glycosylase AlkD